MQLLQSSDFSWHKDQPDVPEMSADEMKAFLDAPVIKLMQKINEIIGSEDSESLQSLATLIATKMDKARADEKFAEMDNAIQTHDEDIYIHGLLINELRKEKLDAVKGVSGTIGIADLCVINYAAEEVTLRYPVNAETGAVDSTVLAAGSMIFKVGDNLYLFPSYKEGEDDLGANREILYERLIPTYDELYGGMIYSLQSVGGYTAGEGIRIENGIISLALENAEGGSY